MEHEQQALSQITPTEARTLLSFMQAHIPESKKLNPAMTWQESNHVDRLFDKVRAVLSCLADRSFVVKRAWLGESLAWRA